jgi:hypothetical protein
MRRIGLVLTAGLAFAVTTVVMRWSRDDAGARARPARTESTAPATPARAKTGGVVRAPAPPSSMDVRPRAATPDLATEMANHALRTAIDDATLEDMFHREVRIEDCFDPALLGGAEKLRFTTDVVASETRATVGTWRLVEVADGAALTEAAIQCAERVLGGDLDITPPDGQSFPTYVGSFSFVYRIPTPSSPG